ncbi:MAG: efflux RND transporter periplasmic adaptor subunit [Rhodoferax sp.]|nr:efflux RND transporter periplasmic adaptor subunit [Rhodoferax sp.]
MKTSLFAKGAVFLALGSLLAGCSRPAPPEEPVRAVKLMTVTVGSMNSAPEFAGEVRARVESRLGFRVAGKLIRRQAEIGQHVRPGQVLAQLDPQDYKLAADAMKAQLLVSTTNRDLAGAEFKRYKDLKEQNFVSGVELDRREASLKAANAQVAQVQAQLASQGNQSGYTSLVADVAGIVTAVEAEAGQVVAVGTPVVRIAQDGPRDVLFSVPEDRLAAISTGSAVAVRQWTAQSTRKGVVREIAALADPVTRTYLVKVAVNGNDALPLGSTVTVAPQALSAKGAQVIKLPTSALKQDGAGSAVWVLDTTSMTVRSQPVQLVAADENDVVVGSGLLPGMQVVTAGVHVLSAGQKVTAYNTVAQAPAGQGAAPAAAAGASSAIGR